MATYDLGDAVPLEHEVRNADGDLTAATVALALTRPDGTTFPAPSITSPSAGVYRAFPVPDAVGSWIGAWSTSGAVVSVKPISFAVGDPAPALYTTLPEVKGAIGKTTSDDRDDLIEKAIAAASRWIDRRCGRRFYADRVASARTFPVVGLSAVTGNEQVLLVDDIASASDLAVATGGVGNWAAVQAWAPGPDNAPAYGRPYTEISALSGWLPATGRVQVTARWGWPTVPDEISQAAQMMAARLYRRKDSPNGVIGSADWGVIRVSRVDPDIEGLIAPFVIPSIA